METKEITIKSVERTSGTKKNGDAWHRISIRATDGKFYSSFTKLAEEALVPGTELEIGVKESKISNTYEITKLISYRTNPSITEAPSAISNPQSGAFDFTSETDFEEAEKETEYLAKKAKEITHRIHPEYEGVSEYPALQAEVLRVLYGTLSNKRLGRLEAEKLKAYGGKFR